MQKCLSFYIITYNSSVHTLRIYSRPITYTEHQMTQKPEFTKEVLRVKESLKQHLHDGEMEVFKISTLKDALLFNLITIIFNQKM